MKKVNLKAYLIAAFCLIVFAGFTLAQTESAKPGDVAKTDSNEIELARQKKHLQLQKELMLKRWRRLKPGMTEKQVQKILGRPKLIQGGSDECVWFYQFLPVSVGGVKDGSVFFEAKSLDSLIKEGKAKHDKIIAEERARCESAIAMEQTRCKNAIKQIMARPPANEAMRRMRDTAIATHKAMRDNAIAQHEIRRNIAITRAESKYKGQVKRLRDRPLAPVFALSSFNHPDWGRFEELLANKKPSGIKPPGPIDKWKTLLSWRKLRINTKPGQVHALLGEPERIKTSVEGRREYYGDISGHGELHFTARPDLEEYLDSWIEPFWPAVEKSLQAEVTGVPSVRYSVLREYKPYKENTENGLGLDILLESDLNKDQIISLLKNLSKGKDPVKISIYTDRTVYENEKKGIYGSKYGKHFLLVYIKNTTVKRAFYGVDEIRWMQESGKFSHLFGKKTPMPTIEHENVSFPKHSIAENKAIGISYDRVMEYLSNFFSMEKTTPVDGQERYMGQTSDSLAILEIIGNKNNISQATLMIGIPADAPDKLVRNTVLAMRFLENTVPEWTNSNEWITANAERVADIPGVSDVKVVKGNKLITMTFLKPFGMLSLTVKHK